MAMGALSLSASHAHTPRVWSRQCLQASNPMVRYALAVGLVLHRQHRNQATMLSYSWSLLVQLHLSNCVASQRSQNRQAKACSWLGRACLRQTSSLQIFSRHDDCMTKTSTSLLLCAMDEWVACVHSRQHLGLYPQSRDTSSREKGWAQP